MTSALLASGRAAWDRQPPQTQVLGAAWPSSSLALRMWAFVYQVAAALDFEENPGRIAAG